MIVEVTLTRVTCDVLLSMTLAAMNQWKGRQAGDDCFLADVESREGSTQAIQLAFVSKGSLTISRVNRKFNNNFNQY